MTDEIFPLSSGFVNQLLHLYVKADVTPDAEAFQQLAAASGLTEIKLRQQYIQELMTLYARLQDRAGQAKAAIENSN